jgi:hypothetical protein
LSDAIRINQQRLGMKRAGHVEHDTVLVVRGRHRHVRCCCRPRRVALNKITESTPPHLTMRLQPSMHLNSLMSSFFGERPDLEKPHVCRHV